MSGLVEFLEVCIAEDEQVARAAVIAAHDAPGAFQPHPELSRWRYEDDGEVEVDWDDPGPYPEVTRVTQDGEGLSSSIWNPGMGHHIARHDPARVLAECEAKRHIVELHSAGAVACEWSHSAPETHAEAFEDGICPTLRALGLPYADRPGYQQEWRP